MKKVTKRKELNTEMKGKRSSIQCQHGTRYFFPEEAERQSMFLSAWNYETNDTN